MIAIKRRKTTNMNVEYKKNNMLVLRMTDGSIAVIDTNELIMGEDNTIIGHFFHIDTPAVAQPIKRYSNQTQIILKFLLTANFSKNEGTDWDEYEANDR